MQRPRYFARYLLFLLSIQAVSISSLYLFGQHELKSFLSERQVELKGQYAMLVNSYEQNVKREYEINFTAPEFLSLMEQASAADEMERERLRRQLYAALLPFYRKQPLHSSRQVHVHLADGTSFLPMHQPDLGDDQSAAVYPSVMLVTSPGKPVAGYAMGESRQDYRFVFPIATDRHLGSVAISIPYADLLRDLMQSFPVEYRFIVKKEMAVSHLDDATLRDHFAPAFFPQFLLEADEWNDLVASHTHPQDQDCVGQEQIDRINEALQRPVSKQLPAFATFSLPFFAGHQAFLVHLLPIHDISGEAAGYLVAYEISPPLLAMKWRYTVGYVLLTAFSLLLVGLHIQYTQRMLQRWRDQQRLQEELNESHAELNQIFDTAADGMRLISLDGVIQRANSTFAGLVHLPLNQIIGRKCHEIFPGEACHTDHCPLILIQKRSQYVESEQERVTVDGRTLTCLLTVSPFNSAKGKLVGIIEDFRDITERKRLERQLETLSTTDELTGLCNRRGFMHLAQQQLDYAKRAGGETFLIFADLDNMKWINDHLGHKAGDKALILTARLLRTTIRDADIVGRMGGDEFAVLLTAESSTASEPILLARLEQELAEINKKLPREERIAISFGIAHNLGGVSLEELIAQADARMYAVKERKKEEAASKPPGAEKYR